jgi:hypothetical protein
MRVAGMRAGFPHESAVTRDEHRDAREPRSQPRRTSDLQGIAATLRDNDC